jgi:hypothetical protein
MAPRFTVLLPTTGERSELVDLALGSLLRQSVQDFELRIVGDGVGPASLARLAALAARDPRIVVHAFPKGARRGEPYRHQVLAHARGRHVAYLLDRDLWLPDHLAVLGAALDEVDFAHTEMMAVQPDGRVVPGLIVRLDRRRDRRIAAEWGMAVAMSSVGHTLAAYRRLPLGWRETPAGRKTDHYMWAQFLAQPWLSARSVDVPTVLYFERGGHPGPPVARWAADIEPWARLIREPVEADRLRQRVLAEWQRPARWLHRRIDAFIRWRPLLRKGRAALRWRVQRLLGH